MYDYKEIEPMLTGRWEEVLSIFDIQVPKFRGINTINHPCPLCGGTDRAHWRQVEGRLSLYCRGCASDRMKSPEEVIQEAHNISFSDLCNDLGEFIGAQSDEKIKRSRKQFKASPKRNMPQNHKQDHAASSKWWEEAPKLASNAFLLSLSAQHPGCLPSIDNNPVFDMVNEAGVIVNLAKLTDNGVEYLAGGPSYGAWHTIEKCDNRQPDGTAWFASPIDGIKHWWSTGQEVRICFSELNLHWMKLVGVAE